MDETTTTTAMEEVVGEEGWGGEEQLQQYVMCCAGEDVGRRAGALRPAPPLSARAATRTASSSSTRSTRQTVLRPVYTQSCRVFCHRQPKPRRGTAFPRCAFRGDSILRRMALHTTQQAPCSVCPPHQITANRLSAQVVLIMLTTSTSTDTDERLCGEVQVPGPSPATLVASLIKRWLEATE